MALSIKEAGESFQPDLAGCEHGTNVENGVIDEFNISDFSVEDLLEFTGDAIEEDFFYRGVRLFKPG